jgi:probable rRNA maturation factor
LIDVEIEDEAWTRALPDAEALVVAAAEAALRAGTNGLPPEGEAAERRRGLKPAAPVHGNPLSPFGTAPPEGERLEFNLVVLLTDDAAVQDLNARFRGKDKPTNVLSFPAAENPERHLGDVALGYGVCAREADEQGKRLAHHLQHLVVHGVLHLLGFDHMSDDEAEAMEGLERLVMAGLGAPDPYDAGGRDHV